MKYYYISNNHRPEGPFTFEELKNQRLTYNTLVWTKGQENWLTANHITELKDLIIATPPPIPKHTNEFNDEREYNVNIGFRKNQNKSTANQEKLNTIYPKYDENYKRETEATITGILLLFFLTAIYGTIKPEFANAISAIFAVIRIPIIIWIVNIAERQNRDSTKWGFFAFFFPSLALIIIGLLKKLYSPQELNSDRLSSEQKKEHNAMHINTKSVNGFNVHIFETNPESKIKSAIAKETFTLKYTLDNIDRYIKFYKSKDYPFYAALELDRRGEILSESQLNKLAMAAKNIYDENNINNVFKKLKYSASENQ